MSEPADMLAEITTRQWEPINLAQLEARPQTRPTIGGVGLVYPGKRHLFSGPPEAAKTLTSYAIALEEVRRGGNVLLVDFEMGRYDARDRLREMGATDEELARILYLEPESQASQEIIESLAATWTFTLVIIDSAAGAYDLQGLDDNARRDVEVFTRTFIRPWWLRSVATLVLDHVTKNERGRGRFAIGSERKVGGVDVHIGFETVLPINRGSRGLYKLSTHKDRLGHLNRPRAAELEFRSEPATHAISWTFRQPEQGSEATPWRPTHLMESVSRYLEGQADGVSRTRVEENVTGTAKYVRAALDALINDGYVEETAGPRRSRPVHSVKPYRESSASESVATASDGLDDPALTSASARRTPYGADTVDAVSPHWTETRECPFCRVTKDARVVAGVVYFRCGHMVVADG